MQTSTTTTRVCKRRDRTSVGVTERLALTAAASSWIRDSWATERLARTTAASCRGQDFWLTERLA
eukprot:8462892-Prorocentrum_lima.AAC.1